jgi:hypothetical protein
MKTICFLANSAIVLPPSMVERKVWESNFCLFLAAATCVIDWPPLSMLKFPEMLG